MDRYGPFGLIKTLLSTIAQAFNPYPKRKGMTRNPVDDLSPWDINEADAYDPDNDDPGEAWWKEQLMKRIEAKEQANEAFTKMMIQEYESKHAEGDERTVEKPNIRGEPVEDHGIPIDGSGTEVEAEKEEVAEGFDNVGDMAETDSDNEDSVDDALDDGDIEDGVFDADDDFDYDPGNYDGI